MEPLKIFESHTRNKREFVPIEENIARVYACGPTVYDFPHIGNLRTFLFVDILHRTLSYLGYEVRLVMNITDVDDKTIAGALRNDLTLREFTEKFTDLFMEDLNTLSILPAWKYPRATEHIPQMLDIINTLVERGYAYERQGSVYFDMDKFEKYGSLSGTAAQKSDSSSEYGRIDADEYERDEVQDFVLWKAARENEPTWDSPWGPGRPGWHIECSAMSMEYLGETLDIHVGAVDLMFPHHENEIAQSEAATGKQFVRYWVHAAHLIVDGQKMSKSLGNFYTLRDLMEKGYSPAAIRHQLLSAHYRHQLNFTLEGLEQSESAVKRLWDFVDRLHEKSGQGEYDADIAKAASKAHEAFNEAVRDDLNIPAAMAAVYEVVNAVNPSLATTGLAARNVEEIDDFFSAADSILGFIVHERQSLDEELDALVREREEARAARDFKRADEIRDQLRERGIVLEDGPDGTHWRFE